jgi:phosphate-selective porin OprO/OprP
VSGGWFLTGESRPYKKSKGTWSRVEPKHPFDPSAGKWGAFEVASRFSCLNLNDANVRGGREANLTVGLNWYLYSNVRMELNYVFANVLSTGEVLGAADGEVNAVMARAQIEF